MEEKLNHENIKTIKSSLKRKYLDIDNIIGNGGVLFKHYFDDLKKGDKIRLYDQEWKLKKIKTGKFIVIGNKNTQRIKLPLS